MIVNGIEINCKPAEFFLEFTLYIWAIIIVAGRSHISDQNVKFWAISN